MTRLLERALAEAATLPEATQDKIGRELLAHVEKLRRLREAIEKGARSLERGEGRTIEIDEVIARATHGGE